MNLAILQARMSSSRLPGKVLKPLAGKPMLLQQIERINRSKLIDKLIVATSTDYSDDAIVEMCKKNNILYYRGSLENVLERFYQISKKYKPKNIVRLTGDCPLIDSDVIDQVIDCHLKHKNDYTSNTIFPTFPDGLDTEVFTMKTLKIIYQMANRPSLKEHVTLYIHENATEFKIENVANVENLSNHRWTVDEPDDYKLVYRIYEALYSEGSYFSLNDILKFLCENTELRKINSDIKRNEGLRKSLSKETKENNLKKGEDKMTKRYEKSELMLKRAMESIPLGAQTYSKSIIHFPYGISPYFASHGKGAYLYDIDGNRYIDFINSQASITLGYNDPDVNFAVKKQLEYGSIFSLSHSIETEVAEKIIEMVPCAEMVRFGKNGSDATAGAVRIARAYTNKEYVAVCGYHGWQDWYIGSTSKDLGVPNAVKELTLKFEYNNIQSLERLFEQYPNKIAAVILEPMNAVEPAPGFLKDIKRLTHQNNAVLIFDEMITGFRYASGGAQEYFGVTPDLATLGKGIANGFPVSAIAGRKDIMMLMEDVFFSFTFGGETLSLAAALATLNKLQKEPVIKRINENGTKVIEEVNKLLETHKLKNVIYVSGHPSWSFLNIKNTNDYSNLEIKTYLMQELFKKGILLYGTHNMSYAHSSKDLKYLSLAYDEVFSELSSILASKTLLEQINGDPLKPLFKVRD